MSAQFDRTNLNSTGDWLRADSANLAPTIFKFSISLWVNFHVVTESDPEIVWYFGDKDTADKYLALEAFPDPTTDETRVRVRFKEGASELVTPDSGVLSASSWHLVTVVATNDGEGDVSLTMYVDDQSTASATVTIPSTSEGNYDRFALGRWAGSIGDANPCSFLAEQVAVWNTDLAEVADHDEMWSNKTPPEELTTSPDLGYWVLAGHHRHGLRASNDSSQAVDNQGDLFNEAGGSQPNLQLSADADPGPLWSVKTPALLYETTGTPGTVPVRAPKVKSSRYNPQFFFFQKPERHIPYRPPETPGIHEIWDHPNFIVMSRVHFNAANTASGMPPAFDTLTYNPPTYLTQVAKRVADWFAYQNFSDMTGSEGGGQYEGCVFLQNLGDQGRDADAGKWGQSVQDGGKGFGIPLERHRLDDATAGTKPQHCWFRANGEQLVKEYSEEFWPLLKAELDRRNLAYPKRLHWDYEHSPAPELAVNGPPASASTFPSQLTDDRGNLSTETPAGEVLADGKTLGDIWGSGNEWNTYFPAKAAYDASNEDWRVWVLGWTRMMRQDALEKAVMTSAANEFSGMQWSNYNDFVADDPTYKHYFNHPKDAVTTPLSTIPADYSAPVLYPNTKIQRLIDNGFGETDQSAQQELWHRAIESCASANNPIPITPWLTSPGYYGGNSPTDGYLMSREDLRWLLWRCWQRGSNEFMLWIDTNVADGEFDAAYNECKDFANTVKCMMNTMGSRTSRMGRTYRICR
jgi:hypothetical protein